MIFMIKKTPEQRFFSKIKINEKTGCWMWQGGTSDGGYGRFWLNGRYELPHRFIYELFIDNIPDGLNIDHLCGNPGCVNPHHLEPVTQKENINRGRTGEVARQTQLSKTHCPQGHPYNGDNLWISKRGGRQCNICRNVSFRKSYLKRKAGCIS